MSATKNEYTLGSLFDGIGGFPYAASFYGIKTLWASEIIPAAVSVTRRHFPDIEHLGDITKLRGGEIAPVDIITFGSPCQSFSIAGQRQGLEGKSGLFWEAVRIIKEMREATNERYPQYCIFENVPGILSANKGRDYQTVLEAFTETEIPLPPSGRWTNAGMVRGGRIDCAWVIHDAQYFGVAQRRRRLFAVCDFTGQRAAEILFKPKSLYGYFAQSGTAGKGITADAAGSVRGTGQSKSADELDLGFDGYNSNLTGCLAATLGVNCGMSTGRNGVLTVGAFMGGQSAGAGSIAYNEKLSPTLKSGAGGNMIPCVCEQQPAITVLNDQGGDSITVEKTEISPTLRSETHGNLPIVTVRTNDCDDEAVKKEITDCKYETYPINTQIATRHNALGKGTGLGIGRNGAPAYTLQEAHSHAVAALGVNQNADGDLRTSETSYTLTTSSNASGRNAPLVCEKIRAFSLDSAASNSMKSKNPHSGCRETETARTIDTTNPCPSKNQGGIAILCVHPETAATFVQTVQNEVSAYGFDLQQITSKTNRSQLKDVQPVLCKAGRPHIVISDMNPNPDVCGTLCAKSIAPNGIGNETDMCILQEPVINEAYTGSSYGGMKKGIGTLRAAGGDNGGGSENLIVSDASARFIVRRLTPVECERLQGYPDGWTEYGHDGKPLSDTARYQALGNSVAIPCVAYVLSGIADELNSINEESEVS